MADRTEPIYFRCECGRLLTDEIISYGICAGHKMRYAQECSFIEWLTIKLGIWRWINVRRAKKEKMKYGY